MAASLAAARPAAEPRSRGILKVWEAGAARSGACARARALPELRSCPAPLTVPDWFSHLASSLQPSPACSARVLVDLSSSPDPTSVRLSSCSPPLNATSALCALTADDSHTC